MPIKKHSNRPQGAEVLAALLLGALAAWLLREPLTQLILAGRTFEGRSTPVQIGVLAAFALVFVAIVLGALLGGRVLFGAQITTLADRVFGPLDGLPATAQRIPDEKTGTGWGKLLRDHALLLCVLMALAVAAYGFELFNLNLTIDEEMTAFSIFTPTRWIGEGRWGLYLLNVLLIPYPVLPFVPLAVALIFNMAGIVILFQAWGITSRSQQIVFGALAITFPALPFLYAFSIINYAVGIGYFCIGISLYVYATATGRRKLLAFLPAALCIAIYQQLLVALLIAFLIYLALVALREEPALRRHVPAIAAVHVLAIATYGLGARLFQALFEVPRSAYLLGRVRPEAVVSHLPTILNRSWQEVLAIYFGGRAAYGLSIPLMGILVGTALLGLAAYLWGLHRSPAFRLGLFMLCLLILLAPFAIGVVTDGVFQVRWLPALPMAVAGVTLLATFEPRLGYQAVLTGVVVITVFQFIQATNRLFASSHLALAADRVLAARVIERLEAARTGLPESRRPTYIQVVGYLERKPTKLMPKADWTFGTSFFEFGDTRRVWAFLRTLGYDELQPLPPELQFERIRLAESMPTWPQQGSVAVVADTVVLNLGGEPERYRSNLCLQLATAGSREYERFCGSESWSPRQ